MRTPGRLQDRLAHDAASAVLGREREIDVVVRQLAPDGAIVTFVHGIGGIGKSSLLAAIEPRLTAAGARTVRLDGRIVEPTPSGFLSAIAHELCASTFDGVDGLARALEAEPRAVALLIDEYDRLRLLDGWLRHTLMPALPDRTRWVVAGRFAPMSAWLTTPGWSDSVLALRLDALDDAASRAVLARRGVAPDVAPSLLTLARGSPLALELAAHQTRNDMLDERAATSVLDALAQRCVDDLPPLLRDAIDAVSVLRRATRPVLEAMLERSCDDVFLQELMELPFVERTDDGLVLHEIVRQAVATRLRALDPLRDQRLRTAAWSALEAMLAEAAPNGPYAWRLTADLLFVVEHPEIRDAFFPTSESTIAIDAALPGDRDAVRAIVDRHEPPASVKVFDRWWEEGRSFFDVARDGAGKVVGLTLIAPSGAVPDSIAEADPLVRAWLADLAKGPGRERGALFVRRVLSLEHGELACEVRGAQWLAAKRAYVERPAQWALYSATRRAAASLAQMQQFGFQDVGIEVGGETTLRLELGALGIWTWLRRLVNGAKATASAGGAAASGAVHRWYVDEPTRGLVVDGRPIALTPLEYGVLVQLTESRGAVVTRAELLDRVWKQRHTGSNVVDALVRLLRKKLGPYGSELETVKGHGYRIARRAS